MRWFVFVVLAGCVSWNVVDRASEREPLYRYRIAMRDDLVSGRATLRDDGTIEFALALDHACVLVPQMQTHHYVTYEREPARWSSALGVTGLAITSLALVAACVAPTEKWVWISAGAGLALTVPAIVAIAKHREVTRESIDPKPVDGLDIAAAPCRGIDPIAALGDLELVTPWGVRATSPIGRDGVARFTIDWAIAPENDLRLAAPWTVIATRRRASGTWRFDSGDAARALRIVRAAAYGVSMR